MEKPVPRPPQALALRRARPSDAEAFARLFVDESVYGGTLQLPWPDAEAWRQRLTEAPGIGQRADLQLVAEVQGELVASAGLHSVGPPLRRRHAMGLGISVAPAWQGQGVGQALMTALCDHADHWAGVLRIELTVFADNARAVALYRRHGFEVEGRMRGYALRHGQYADCLAMARLHPRPPTWPPASTPLD